MKNLEDWESRLIINFNKLEDWEQKYVEKVKDEIKNLLLKNDELNTNLKKTKDLSNDDKYSTYWELKENYEQLYDKFSILQRWSQVKFNTEIDRFLCHDIYYFELCFSMLKEKFGAEYTDLRYYLNAVLLEYEYFIEKDYDLPRKFFEERFEFQGNTNLPKLNLIINNIKNAQKNLRVILARKEEEENRKELFLFYEVMGDLYIHIYLLWKDSKDLAPDKILESMKQAYYYYLRSLENRVIFIKQKGDYSTHYDGLHRMPWLGIFVDFYNDIGVSNIHDVKLKLEQLEHKQFLKKNDIEELKNKVKVELHGS